MLKSIDDHWRAFWGIGVGGLIANTDGTEDWVLSSDGTKIFVAGDDGNLRIYASNSGDLLDTIDVGQDLDGLALSPDGTKLALTEAVARNVVQSNNWTSNSATIDLHIVDLDAGTTDTHSYNVFKESWTFQDVVWVDANTLHLSENILPGWSGWQSLVTIKLATDQLFRNSSYYSGLGYAPSLTLSPDGTDTLLGQLGLSSAEYFVIGEDGKRINTNGIYRNDVYGYAQGVEALSGTGPGDFIALASGGGLYLYTGELRFLKNLSIDYPNLANTPAITFSADGSSIYVVDPVANGVRIIDTTTYEHIGFIEVDTATVQTLRWGEELVLSHDGATLYLNTTGGVIAVPLPLTLKGTSAGDRLVGRDGDDQLTGLDGDDTLFGRGGDDTLRGGAGNDRLHGGSGADTMIGGNLNDFYYVDDAGDRAVEKPDEGRDTIFASVSYRLAVNVENLRLTGNGNIDAAGNALDNRLVGNDGDNRLNGLGGADIMAGGLGDDTYVVDDLGDRVREEAGGGADAVISTASFVLWHNVENLTLAGSGDLAGHGNSLANVMRGNGGANVLDGQGGDDRLIGGDGNDWLVGGLGADVLIGGGGADTFVFPAIGDSPPLAVEADLIVDFDGAAGDMIFLAGIDADIATEGNQAFAFIGTAAFSHTAGELRYGGNASATWVQGDIDGDGAADFMIRLNGEKVLAGEHFVL